MAKNKKYDSNIEQEGSLWNAQITRQITSKKTIVSKQQDGFENEAEAKEWAEQQLAEFAATLGASNKRHGEQRKLNEEERRQRSARRAEKTLNAKNLNVEEELKVNAPSDENEV